MNPRIFGPYVSTTEKRKNYSLVLESGLMHEVQFLDDLTREGERKERKFIKDFVPSLFQKSFGFG